jgi:hydrogenase expression/formation protein HypD
MINAYPRIVHPQGNPEALRILDTVFEVADREWRGLGTVPMSGLDLRPEYGEFDAARRFPGIYSYCNNYSNCNNYTSSDCPAADVLLGKLQPNDCPHFGTRCTPDSPLGAPMVSPEGACAAFFLHRRR